MSFYTGRYVRSHGSTWNGIPLKVGEMTLGDHLRPLGVRTALVGKTHMKADTEGMKRLGIDIDSEIGALVSECGFEPYERDDGLHPDGPYGRRNENYNDYMKQRGWDDVNPWDSVANSAEDDDGTLLSGWFLDNSDKPARAKDEESETPYTTRRAMDFIREAGDTSWCLHLSYIKPHWPYIVPAPYHDMYPPETHMNVVRDDQECVDPHPVFDAFMQERVSRSFRNNTTRTKVIGAYMGLIKQIDDQLGVLMAFLEAQDRLKDTMIIFTSDHGDYLGDHWLGEKELFHDPSARIPLIVVDPTEQADATRGRTLDTLTEAIDVTPTILDFMGGTDASHILEGHSLLPILHGHRNAVREFAVSEYDYSFRQARALLGVPISDAKLTMVFDGRWKYVFAEGFRPMLFDLKNDPQELTDLGAHPDYTEKRQHMRELLFNWSRRTSQRTTMSDAQVDANSGSMREVEAGILIGWRTEEELKDALQEMKTDHPSD